MTLDDWLNAHRFLDPVARVCGRIEAAVAALPETVVTIPESWDEYAEEFATGVPLLHSQMPIDVEPAGQAVINVLRALVGDPPPSTLAEDAATLCVQLQQERLAAGRVAAWLLGDESWAPAKPGLLRSVGWITLAVELRPLVQTFAGWRDEERWLRRYCPTCGALPSMAQLIGVDPGRLRLMVCGRCTSRWRYGRTACPFCETASHRLASIGIEGEGGLRIDYCESCRGYLKTYNGQGDERVLLADWTSLHLDVAAGQRGLKRLATSLFEFPEMTPTFGASSAHTESSTGASPQRLHWIGTE